MEVFWLIIVIFCTAWYATMTLYVGIKGFFDIFSMLRSIKDTQSKSNTHYSI